MHINNTRKITYLLTVSVIAISVLTGCFKGRYQQPAHDLAKMLGANSANTLMDFDASGFDVFNHYVIFKPSKELTTVDITNAVRLFNPKASISELKPFSMDRYEEPIQKFFDRSTPVIRAARVIRGGLMLPAGNKTWEINWSIPNKQLGRAHITFIPYSSSTESLEIDSAPITESIVIIRVTD